MASKKSATTARKAAKKPADKPSRSGKVKFVLAAPPSKGKLGEILPIPRPVYKPTREPDLKKVDPPPAFTVKPPKGAPNVLIILLDQSCYADPTGMGGPINTPAFDRLAKNGLKYVNFHVNPLCSPTRAALLTGRTQHQCSMAGVAGTANAYPCDSSIRPQTINSIGKILQSWGYCTSYFGKCNETPEYMVNVSGPFDLWPTHTGFDKFYGYIAGEQSLFHPSLVDGTTFIGTPNDPDYHFNTDLTNKAVDWIRATRSLTPDRPFLMYYAQSASHPPHTPPVSWLKKDLYKGKFDQGWDKIREEILERQIKLGIVPPGTKLAANPDSVQKWDDLSADEKKVYARQMEVYATLTEHADYEVGRLIDGIEEMGELDNTLIFYIFGDNGGSIIGDLNGTFVEWSALNNAPEDVPYLLSRLDEYGGPNSYPNYAVGWAMAGSTPATWAITMAHGGGNNAGMAVHWPAGIKTKGEVRRQYASVIDVVPTILEAVGIPAPKIVNGIKQTPMAGISMKYSFNNGRAKERHTTQYNEGAGNRSIYHEGWMAAVVHNVTWEPTLRAERYEDDKWELYNMKEDFGLANDLSDKYPKKVEQMKKLFDKEAIKYGVYPMDDRRFERLNAEVSGRPDIMAGRKELTVYPGMPGMTENSFIDTKSRSLTITCDLEIPKGGAEGVVIAQAGMFGGWSLYLKNGKPKYAYNWLAREKYVIEALDKLPEGKVKLVYDFDYDGGGLHKGGTGKLLVNGKKVAEGRIDKTMGALYSLAAETADIGLDSYSPVTDDYDPWDNSFTGTIKSVTLKHKD